MGRIVMAVIVVGAAMHFSGIAAAADYPVRAYRGANAAPRDWPVCYVSRYAYVRYAPVLATARSIRPVIVSTPVPCPVRG